MFVDNCKIFGWESSSPLNLGRRESCRPLKDHCWPESIKGSIPIMDFMRWCFHEKNGRKKVFPNSPSLDRPIRSQFSEICSRFQVMVLDFDKPKPCDRLQSWLLRWAFLTNYLAASQDERVGREVSWIFNHQDQEIWDFACTNLGLASLILQK